MVEGGKSRIKNQIKVMASLVNNAANIYIPGSQTYQRPAAKSPKADDGLLSKVN